MNTELTEQLCNRFDVVVIGGGAAGLSAALVLARGRRSVIVIDAGAPRNAPASGVHGFLTRDGLPPAELIAIGQREVVRYGGVVQQGEAQAARRTHNGFEVTLGDGSMVTARRVLVTTGLIDELPEVPGVRERWGRDCCTARTATVGSSATSRSVSWAAGPGPCTRPCCSAS